MQAFDGETETLLPSGGDSPRDLRNIKNASKDVRRGFIRKVYGLLTVQLIVTVATASEIYSMGQNKDWLASHEWLLWLSVFATIGTICAMSCCEKVVRQYPQNYIFLFTFTFFESIMIGFVSAAFTWQSLLLAAGITVIIFLGLTLYAFNTAVDFTGYGPYLFAALLGLVAMGMVLSILSMFGVSVDTGILIYDFIGVLLFSFFIIFDTQLMMGEYGGHQASLSIDDYVMAALILYMDIVNLFHLLSLLGDRH